MKVHEKRSYGGAGRNSLFVKSIIKSNSGPKTLVDGLTNNPLCFLFLHLRISGM